MKPKIVFYTQIYYLDAALEYIDLCSEDHHLDVLIELTAESLKAGIFNLNIDLYAYPHLIPFDLVANEWDIAYLSPYFLKCNSVYFTVHAHKRSLTLSSFYRAFKTGQYISKLKPQYIHFDEISMRQIGLLPYLLLVKKKLILNVHDPTPHSGEKDLKKDLYKKIIYFLIGKFVCLSDYSGSVLNKIISQNKKVHLLKLLPYTVYKNFLSDNSFYKAEYISFIGRISPYKGVDIFLNAIEEVSKEFPDQKFIVAGNPIASYKPNTSRLNNVSFIFKHLSNYEIAEITAKSKLIVCPYIDATQSGVIMTAYALGCPVMVTPVGGLPEYVDNGVTGIILNTADSLQLASQLKSYICDKKDLMLKNNLMNGAFQQDLKKANLIKMEYIYQ
jgi:glycosyltransferase involved in cell wall biosynthesis